MRPSTLPLGHGGSIHNTKYLRRCGKESVDLNTRAGDEPTNSTIRELKTREGDEPTNSTIRYLNTREGD